MKQSDKEVASEIYSLGQSSIDINHETICTIAYARIIYLHDRLDKAERALVEVLDCLIPKELEGCGMSPERVAEIEAIALLKKATMELE